MQALHGEEMSEPSVQLLYRHILRAAKRFPSVKREGILREIKTEFHANKVLPMRACCGRRKAPACTAAMHEVHGVRWACEVMTGARWLLNACVYQYMHGDTSLHTACYQLTCNAASAGASLCRGGAEETRSGGEQPAAVGGVRGPC